MRVKFKFFCSFIELNTKICLTPSAPNLVPLSLDIFCSWLTSFSFSGQWLAEHPAGQLLKDCHSTIWRSTVIDFLLGLAAWPANHWSEPQNATESKLRMCDAWQTCNWWPQESKTYWNESYLNYKNSQNDLKCISITLKMFRGYSSLFWKTKPKSSSDPKKKITILEKC